MGILDFFSAEAGQARRQWLNRQEEAIDEALNYYLGPAAAPVHSAAQIAGLLSPGADMMDAFDASGRLMNATGPLDAAAETAALIGATGMMFLPGNYNALREGIGSVADDLVAAYDPALVRSGLGPVSETPAQAVARLLREGRAADVTDDMMARVDPQEMWQLYEAGATGADMPMDLASRMARAQDMGFDTQTLLYHGTGADFPAFSLANDLGGNARGKGIYAATSPETASRYAMRDDMSRIDLRPEGEPTVTPVLASGPVFDEMSVLPMSEVDQLWRADHELTTGLGIRQDWVAPREYFDRSFPPRGDAVLENMSSPRRAIIEQGYTGQRGPSVAGTGDDVVMFDPRNIRSQFARFDPRLSHLANLSAGIALPVIGMNALAQQQQDQDRQIILDWLDSQGL